MSRAGSMMLAVGGVALALAAVAGCARDIGGSATDVTGAGSPLTNGSRIRGSVVEQVSALVPTVSYRPEPTRRDFSAVVRNGQATLDGGAIAVSRGLARGTSDVEFADREGRQARLVARSSAPGRPAEGFQVYRDGQLLVDVAIQWQNLNGAWVLGQRTLTVYDHGRAVLRHTRAVDGATLASAQVGVPGLDRQRSLLSILLPQRLEAQWYRCMGEATMTVLAASGVAAATAAFIAAPSPGTYAMVLGAIAIYDKTMDAYVECVSETPSND